MLGTYCPHFTRFCPPNTPSRRPPTTNRAKSDSITGHLQSHRPRIRCLYATDSHCRHQACCCTASITEDSSRRSEHLKDATRLLPRAQWVACSQAPLMAERAGLMNYARHRIHLCHAAPTFLPTRWRLAPPWQRSARARRRQPVGRFLREMRPPSMRAIAGRRLVRRSGRAETAMGAQGGTRGPSWQPGPSGSAWLQTNSECSQPRIWVPENPESVLPPSFPRKSRAYVTRCHSLAGVTFLVVRGACLRQPAHHLRLGHSRPHQQQ